MNNLPTYQDLEGAVGQIKDSHVAVVSKDITTVSIGESSVITKSVIGRNVVIGNKAKISNSVILGNCVIGNDCII